MPHLSLPQRRWPKIARLTAGALVGACALLDACALQPANDSRATASSAPTSALATHPQQPSVPPGHVVPAGLRSLRGHEVLDRPLDDYYDTAFVLADGGSAAPRILYLTQLTDTLGNYDVVVYGESHGHPGVHLQQMNLLQALVERDPRWILSLEQFERDVQGVVDDYLAGRVGQHTLTHKGRAWDNYAASYRPLLVFAKEHHLPAVAAEAPDWTIACIGQWGPGILGQFTPAERDWVAHDIDVGAGPYREKFMHFLGGSPSHGGGGESTPEAQQRADRSFAAQVARDDTMAESIQNALNDHPGYKVLHLTGSFHAEGFLGTVARLRKLDPALKVAVIDPVEVDDSRSPAFPTDRLKDGTVLQLIYPNPDEFVDGESMGPMTAHMHHVHDLNRCKYTPPGMPADPTKK